MEKKTIVGIVLICLFLATPLSSAFQIDKCTTVGCDDSTIYYMANDFNFTDIYVYPACLYMESGNITTDSASGWINMSMEVLNQADYIEFSNNITANNITIENGFANFSITDGVNCWLEYQANGTFYQRQTPSGGEVAFTSVPASSWVLRTNDTTLPYIKIDSTVLNATSYFKTPVKVNYTVTESYQNKTWYIVTNSTSVIVSNTIITSNTSFSISADGEYTLKVYSDDKAGNENSTTITNFKGDITAPTITSGSVSAASVLVGDPITITCQVSDTYAGVDLDGVSVQVTNPKGMVANYSMAHGTGDNYSYTYSYTGASGTYLIKYFYAYDNSTGSDGNLASESSELYFNTIPYTGGDTGGGGGGGGAPAPAPTGNETLAETIIEEVFVKPMHLFGKVLQRIYPFYTFPPQEKVYEFPGADKPLASCLASEGAECVVDVANNHTFYIVYAPSSDDFFIKEAVINVTAYDEDGYVDFAVLQLTIINLGAYLPIEPYKLGTPAWLTLFFKLEDDINGVKWITGVRWLWIFIAGAFILGAVGLKREEIIKYSSRSGLDVRRIRGMVKKRWK